MITGLVRPRRKTDMREWRQDPPEEPEVPTCGECGDYRECEFGSCDFGICTRLSTWPNGLFWVSAYQEELEECGGGE